VQFARSVLAEQLVSEPIDPVVGRCEIGLGEIDSNQKSDKILLII
jgi:hypothetical protein